MQIYDVELSRELKQVVMKGDLVVVGGGLAGVCAAITAARENLKVILVQDRPVLGGNASSEVRLWALGATSHLGNNNRWSREGYVMDEILVENLYRNPEGNPNLFDALLHDLVTSESNITLLLDTAVYEVTKADAQRIETVEAFCSQNGTKYILSAPLFCDASGDGIVGFLGGASFRVGAESADEFDEQFAPDESYGGLLGHSMYFYSRDTGKPVKFVPPSFALDDITEIPRYKNFQAGDTGCSLWWLEYGGRLDTIHDTHQIKQELMKIIYGVWNHIKNSGEFPESETLTLEWVGTVPGKRESRRFEGDYMINQRDVIDQRVHDDAIAYGGWAIDLHPGDGVYSKLNGCTQWHSKGVYQIPYRTMYSRDISNLFLAGRVISASHVAFGSTRVMATTGHSAQAVGMAAAMCRESGLEPRDLLEATRMQELQQRLLRKGHYIPGVQIHDTADLAAQAKASASSEYQLSELAAGDEVILVHGPKAMLLPCRKGSIPDVTFLLNVEVACDMEVQLRTAKRLGNYTPDITLETRTVSLEAGTSIPLTLSFESELPEDQYIFICLMGADGVGVLASEERVTGVLSVAHQLNKKVAKSAVQKPPEGIGVERVEFWLPQRRPDGKNFAIKLSTPIDLFEAQEVTTGPQRPTVRPNAWVAASEDSDPRLTLTWDAPVKLKTIALCFDTDFDHPMETVQMGHSEQEIPFCVKDFDLLNDAGAVIYQGRGNHRTRHVAELEDPVETSSLTVRVLATHGAPAAIFNVQCFDGKK